MSDALALLDGAAARVSALLMPDGLHSLISFLRGEAWEEISPSLQIPNVLISCYNYTPLAIAADASLVSLASSGERSALVQTFERYEFRVFVVNFMPESSSSGSNSTEDVMPHKGNSNSNNSHSGSIIRMKCMESVQAWCDGVYKKEEPHSGLEHDTVNIDSKRMRYEERERTTTTTNSTTTTTNNNNSTGMNAEKRSTQRVLFIIRCCADANVSRSGAERSRRSRDPLLLLLHDITATAALCRAREHTQHTTRLRFSVLLLPDDLAYGGALLEESLKAPLVREYYVRLFRGSAAQIKDEEQLAFLHRLEMWIGGGPATAGHSIDTTDMSENKEEKEEKEKEEKEKKKESVVGDDVRRRSSSMFFIRRDNLPLCCFLREALRRFPLILHPTALRQLQTLWAARHQLSDVVAGFHTLLCPFTLSSSRYSTTTTIIRKGKRIRRRDVEMESERDGMTRLSDSVDLLNALLTAAGQWADGHALNEAVAFAVLYEDLVWKRPTRLQRVPSFVSALQHLWERRQKRNKKNNNSDDNNNNNNNNNSDSDNDDDKDEDEDDEDDEDVEMVMDAALRWCVPVYTPSCMVQDESYQHEKESKEEKEKTKEENSLERRAAVMLPAVMMAPAARVPIVAELMRSALLAVLPPHDSLEELKNAVNNNNNKKNDDDKKKKNHVDIDSVRTTGNNFFSTFLPDSARVLHVLAAHALSHTTVQRKFVSFALLQRVCQLSDEALVRALKELQLAGMVALNGREFTARTLLDN